MLERPHLAVEISSVLLVHIGNANHPASVLVTAEESNQGDDDFFGIDTVGLRSPLLAVDFDRGGLNDVAVDAHRNQAAMNPESVASSFVAA